MGLSFIFVTVFASVQIIGCITQINLNNFNNFPIAKSKFFENLDELKSLDEQASFPKKADIFFGLTWHILFKIQTLSLLYLLYFELLIQRQWRCGRSKIGRN